MMDERDATATEALRSRFRSRCLDRLSTIEDAWRVATHGAADTMTKQVLLRELHTIKGDADLLGFDDMCKLADGFEHIVGAAVKQDFALSEEIHLLAEMAIQFLGMLLQTSDESLKGIDVGGFVQQIHTSLAQAHDAPTSDPIAVSLRGRARRMDGEDRVSPETLERLGVAATTAFIESLAAAGASRRRLDALWRLLREEVVRMQQTRLAEELEPHLEGAAAFARRLDKEVRIERKLGECVAPTHALDALNTAVVHVLRNAIVHGIESPEVRRACGKPEVATIRVSAADRQTRLFLAIEDDGGGVDLEVVRTKAAGMLDGAEAASDAELIEVLFSHGFTTRDRPDSSSGRGVGLDAVRKMARSLGGDVAFQTANGQGTCVSFTIPAVARTMEIQRFRAAGCPIELACPGSWAVEHRAVGANERAVDPIDAVQLIRDRLRSHERPTHVLELTRGDDRVKLFATSAPEPLLAQRPCPTGAHGVEVLEVDGREVLLIRPEKLRWEHGGASAGRNPVVMNRVAGSLLMRADIVQGGQLAISNAVVASPSTIFVNSRLRFGTGEPVHFALSLPGVLSPIACTGEVASRQVKSNPGEPEGLLITYGMGLGGDVIAAALCVGDDAVDHFPVTPLSLLVAVTDEALRVSFAAVLRQMQTNRLAGAASISVRTANDTASAVRLSEAEHCDIMIVDVQVAGDVHTLIGRARASRVHVIALGPDSPALRDTMLTNGADMYLQRPVSVRAVLDTMRRLQWARSSAGLGVA